MKRLFFFLFFINIVHLSVAALPDKDLVAILSDATFRSGLKSIRRITFNDGMMLVDMNDGSSTSWNTDWVNCVMFVENEQETAIDGVAFSASFEVKDNILLVDCASTRMQLCMCDGKIVYDGVCTGKTSLDMNSLPAGMYVLKLDGYTYKIINR